MTDPADDIVTGGAWRGAAGAALAKELGLATRFQAGDTVGPFRLLSELGEGGSSVVFLAARENGTFAQTVALKVWRDASSAQRAVVAESNLLGRLNHPNIARIIDAGLLGSQDAWLAMAHVAGEHIDRAAERLAADWRRRLAWLRTVSLAVHYAHQQWIAHGDIKPSNVLIDVHGEPCLLDFGIAQHLNRGEGSAGCTPGFASPEQLRGEPITAASDVYQLGKLASVLLPDTLPMPRQVRRALSQVLERAMATDPRARQDTAQAFGTDLDRLCRAMTPLSVRLSGSQRLGLLWLRQGRALIGTAMLFALAMILAWQWQREQAASTALIVRQQSAKNELARLNAALMVEALRSVGGEQDAFRNFVREQQAQALSEQHLDPWVKYEMLNGLAAAHVETADYDEAQFVIQQALAIRHSMAQPDDLGVAYLRCLDALSAALTGQINDARSRAGQSAALLSQFAAQDPELTFRTQSCLSSVYVQVGDVAKSGTENAAALAFAAKRYGVESREYVEAMTQAAEIARIRMDFKQALAFNEYVSARMNRWFGAGSRRGLEQFIRLQGTRAEAGDPAAAEQALASVIDDLRQHGRTDNYPFHAANYYRAEALQMLGRYTEAESAFNTALSMMTEEGMEAPTLHRLSDAAAASRLKLELGQPALAISAHRDVLAFTRDNETDPVLRSLIMVNLADALLEQSDGDAEAAALLDEAQPLIEREFGPNSFHALLVRLQRVRLHLVHQQLDRAREVFEQTSSRALDPSIPAHTRLLLRWRLLAVAIKARAEDAIGAEQAAEDAVQFARDHLGAEHPLTAVAQMLAISNLGDLAPRWQQTALAAAKPILQRTHPAQSRYRQQAEAMPVASRLLSQVAEKERP